ncbi:MAG: carboxypeptidase regulatory-like domain-containing protein, partial [Bacteroidetes bacterium]|nr:carboxypeptidase regulatory-like domain-containing protein [Bacteroidota bacterium]
MTRVLIVLTFLLPRMVLAQYAVTGKVLDRENGSAVANANVFLNNATIGDKTGPDGTFKFQQVKAGTYHLIVSMIGFNTFETAINVNSDIKLPDIYIDRKIAMLSEVRITPVEDPDRNNNIELFKQVFLGTSQLAKQCKLVNPEVLDFDYDKKSRILTAKSSDLLVIENYALGYRIKYLLSDFMYDQAGSRFRYGGRSFFEEMKGSDSQRKKWNEARQEAYKNSLQHFLRSAIDNQLKEAGFTVFRLQKNPDRPADSLINKKIAFFSILKKERPYRDSLDLWIKRSKLPKISPGVQPVNLTGEDIIQPKDKRGFYALECENDPLYVVHNDARPAKSTAVLLNRLRDQNNNSATLVNFNQPIVFMDQRGILANPESLSFIGVWANKKIADLLPDNYEPPETEPIDKALFTRVDSLLKKYVDGHEIEKAYLHFDKPLYMAGDTIYFKAYVTDIADQPSILSKILNVELIDPRRHISQAIKLKLTDGMAAGDFALPDTLTTGYYRVRAYTGLMAADGNDYLFEKYIRLVNPEAKTSSQPKNVNTTTVKYKEAIVRERAVPNKIDIQFFPEGGNLVAGVKAKIAFKAIAGDGLGISVRGIIADDQGHKICDFASRHLGMGDISFTPRPGSSYKAWLSYPDSSKVAYQLPKPDDSGLGLNIINSDPRFLTINVSAGAQNHQSQVSIAGQSCGKICYFTSGRITKGRYSVTVRKELFPEGIVRFTLFAPNGQPVNERLVFVRNHNDEINLNLSGTSSISRSRQKVKLNVVATGSNHQPVVGSFSASVIDITHLPYDAHAESTILSQLLLTSELKGYIEQPGYYFDADNEQVNADLDLLMLTQGYHGFEWKQLLVDKFPPGSAQPERIQRVTGTIKTMNGKPAPNARISMFSVSRTFFSLDTVADENGRFVFADFPTDSMHYVIQAADKELRKKTIVSIDHELPPRINENNQVNENNSVDDDTTLTAYIKLNQRFHQEQQRLGFGKPVNLLKEVVIKAKTTKKYLENSENLNGRGNANDVITADQLPVGALTFKDAIIAHLRGIQYLDGNFYYGFFPTLVLLDGFEVQGNLYRDPQTEQFKIDPQRSTSQADILNTIPISSIASVEIITDASLAAAYGVRGSGGVIIITTKKWNDMIRDAKNVRANHADYFPPVFYKARTFYSPKYDAEKNDASFSDLRTTIYWTPNLNTDERGNASFEFFNSDNKGTYLVVIEG